MSFLDELRKLLACHIKNATELDDNAVRKIVNGIIENIRHELAGRTVYVPTNHKEMAFFKRQAIFNDIKNGIDDETIRKSYGISAQWLNKLKKKI